MSPPDRPDVQAQPARDPAGAVEPGVGADRGRLLPSLLPALIVGQLGVHSAMAGQRMAAPLQALRDGHSAFGVGVLLALFAALPVLTALGSGRMADRHGYHRPLRWAVGLVMAGALLSLGSTRLPAVYAFAALCLGGTLSGVGANLGMITIQRAAGRLAGEGADRVRVFSWLGIAPSLANVVGPVAAGFMIDGVGFGGAYALMMLLPLVSLAAARRVPADAIGALPHAARRPGRAIELLRLPGFTRLLVVNWLMSASWDVHSFAVPVLGHERGFNASTIGLILGVFTLSVTGVRVLIPTLAHRLREVTVLRIAMAWTGVVLALYPWAHSPWLMGALAVLLGLSLGAVQPMIMSTLHRLTPEHRHGEAIGLRSMALNASSSLMPLAFGAAGAALGPAVLFWTMAAAVAGGSSIAGRLPRDEPA